MLKMKKKIAQSDAVWFMYFTIMMNFYTYTYVQLLAQILLVLYIGLCFFYKRGKIKISSSKMLINYLLWYGLFVLWACITKFWAVYPPRQDANTLFSLLRILVIGCCMVYFVATYYQLDRLIIVFIYSGALFCIITILSNPISAWGTTNFFSFDGGYMRNGIANFCLILIGFLALKKKCFSQNKYTALMVLFVITIIICGSRRAVVQLLLMPMLYIITIANVSNRLKKIAIISIVFLVAGIALYAIPYIRITYFDRILSMFQGTASTDGSTVGRNAYIIIGTRMIAKRPFFGWGIDAFYSYLLENPYAFSNVYHLTALYSHNNYIEIGTCFGIIGLILFYRMHLSALILGIKKYKKNLQIRMLLIIIILYLIGDYGGIVFSNHISMYFLTILFLIKETYTKKENYND